MSPRSREAGSGAKPERHPERVVNSGPATAPKKTKPTDALGPNEGHAPGRQVDGRARLIRRRRISIKYDVLRLSSVQDAGQVVRVHRLDDMRVEACF
jgi:hypothetical protein